MFIVGQKKSRNDSSSMRRYPDHREARKRERGLAGAPVRAARCIFQADDRLRNRFRGGQRGNHASAQHAEHGNSIRNALEVHEALADESLLADIWSKPLSWPLC